MSEGTPKKCCVDGCEEHLVIDSADAFTKSVCIYCRNTYCDEHAVLAGEYRVICCTCENGGGTFDVFICGECDAAHDLEDYDLYIPFSC